MDTTLKPGIEWVGYVDWTVRDFHGYRTELGSSYNSYLVQDEKTVLVDTVKAPYVEQLLRNVSAKVALDAIDYVICNHAEPDHSGGLPRVMEACRNAQLVCNAKCREALSRHFDTRTWTFRVVKDGESLSIGRRTLVFIDTPMVHWPESMFTYIPEEELLFSMDAFGQHYASAHRFDDQEPIEVVMAEAKTYFANIVMLYGRMISTVLDKAGALKISMVAPSHGVIWRKHIAMIVEAYRGWVTCRPAAKVVVLYDTMWKSTEMMAQAIHKGALELNVDARLHNVRVSNLTVLATEMLDTATVAVGSPTLNQTLMPQVAAILTYLKGLKPAGKAGFAFGSYGWAKAGARDVEQYLKDMKVEILREPLQVQFVPDAAMLEECRQAGRMLAEKALAMAAAGTP